MGRLILIRHGESTWNQQNRFTGWVNISLSDRGVDEAKKAGELLADEQIDVAFTSTLVRAQDTLYEILKLNKGCHQYRYLHQSERDWYRHFTPDENDARELKIYSSERLNERFYGDLQGLNKDKARQQFGAEQVHQWRRSYRTPPPGGESLEMTAARTIPYYRSHIVPHLERGEQVLVSAHGNSLRSITMHIEDMSPQQILDFELATGTPHVYEFNEQMQLIK